MAKYNAIPIEILHQLLICDPETGTLTWRVRALEFFKCERDCNAWNSTWAGKPALASDTGSGYLSGAILGEHYRAHRVIWAMHYGYWPPDEIDHDNRVKNDNRISNLVLATHIENRKNFPLSTRNTSGIVGVYWTKANLKWLASIGVDRKLIHLGYFDYKPDAIAARKAAEVQYGFHPNHGKKS